MSKLISDVRASSKADRAKLVLLLVSLGVLPVLAVVANVWVFAPVVIASYVLEILVTKGDVGLLALARRIQLGNTLFALVRQSAVLIFAIETDILVKWQLIALVAGVAVTHGIRALLSTTQAYVEARRKLPVMTRNIDLSPLRIPDAPKLWLRPIFARLMHELDMPIAAGIMLMAVTKEPLCVVGGVAVSLIGQLTRLTLLGRHAMSVRHLGNKKAIFKHIKNEVIAHNPEVAFYFSGSPTSAYQINSWLETMEKVDRPSMIILRAQVILDQLGPTSLPVVCVPDAVDLMNLELPTLHTILYAANVGPNIHMLRVPGVTHVFVGHGDSDKPASFNPYTKVYDEVWTAGKAGRDRYAVADIGVEDKDIVEVGRPQLSVVKRAGDGPAPKVTTVLYAPTWEGWTTDLQHASLKKIGIKLVERLIAHGSIRVLYKPHPLTGTRDRSVLNAHKQILAMLNEANARAGYPPADNVPVELGPLTARIGEVNRIDPNSDPAQRSRDLVDNTGDLQAQLTALTGEWNAVYWGQSDPAAHHVVSGQLPRLYDMFNEADVLITDVSSVISEFIASQKPYVVCNPGNQPEARFKAANPASSASYLLGPDLANLDEIIAQVEKLRADPGYRDPKRDEREALSEYLIGPAEPPAIERFNAAIHAASAASKGARRAAD